MRPRSPLLALAIAFLVALGPVAPPAGAQVDEPAAPAIPLGDLRPGSFGLLVYERLVDDDTIYFVSASHNGPLELRRTDLTARGSFVVREFQRYSMQAPFQLAALRGGLLFTMPVADYQMGLYSSDGTPEGTGRVGSFSVTLLGPAAGDQLFFIGSDEQGTSGLWRTNGTAAGTSLVAPASAAGYTSTTRQIVWEGAGLAFAADRVWYGDGTLAGTMPLTPPTLVVRDLVAAGPSRLFFTAAPRSDGVQPAAHQLWTSDGTPAGTRMVVDLAGGTVTSGIADLMVERGRLFFTVARGDRAGLWVSDGTPDGTRRLLSLAPDEIAVLDGQVYAAVPSSQGVTFYRSNGSQEAQRLAGVAAQVPAGGLNLTAAGGALFFAGATPTRRVLFGLKPDGGVRTLAEFPRPQEGEYNPITPMLPPYALTPFRGGLAFVGKDEQAGAEWWLSDGTPVGTRLPVDAVRRGLSSGPTFVAALPGRTIFAAAGRLWASDGTRGGTLPLAGIESGEVVRAEEINGRAVILVHYRGRDYSSTSLWLSDGTPAGTRDVYSTSLLTWLGQVGSAHYFVSPEGLWTTDGTPAGTRLAHQFAGQTLRFMVELRGRAFFGQGGKLWAVESGAAVEIAPFDVDRAFVIGGRLLGFRRPAGQLTFLASDGTAAGTSPIASFSTGLTFYQTALVGERLFVVLSESTSTGQRYQVIASNGTPAGTAVLSPEAEGLVDLQLSSVVIGDRLIIRVHRDFTASSIWSSDGTVAGTVPDLWAAAGLPAPRPNLAFSFASNNAIYHFLGGAPPRLLRSDGTVAGTTLLELADVTAVDMAVSLGERDLLIGRNGYGPCGGVGRCEVWSTDGTQAGTRRLAGPAGGLTAVRRMGGRAIFDEAAPGGGGLWASDGTPEGTRRIARFPWEQVRFPSETVAGALLFTTIAGDGAARLWRTDGSEGGTRLVQAGFYAEPGSGQSGASGFARVAGGLFFAGDTFATGAEPWLLPDNIGLAAPALVGGAPGGAASVTVQVAHNASPAGARLVVELDPRLTLIDAGENGLADGARVSYPLDGLGYLGAAAVALRVRLPTGAPFGTRYALTARLERLPQGDPAGDNLARVELMAARQLGLPMVGR